MSRQPLAAKVGKASGMAQGLGPLLSRATGTGTFLMLVVFLVVVRLDSPHYWSGANLRAILLATAIPVILGITQLVVILAGNFDISIGSTLGLSAMSVGFIYRANPGMPPAVAFLLGLGIGAAVGVCVGFLVAYIRIPSIVLTLGAASIIAGITYLVAGGREVDPEFIPNSFIAVSTSPAGVPGIVIIAFGVVLLILMGLRWTRFGRTIYAVGSNTEAARLQGLPVRRVEIATFVLSGAGAGLAGAVYLSQYHLVNLFSGSGQGFQAITIVIVGGASIAGGAGSAGATFLSALLIVAMGNGLAVLGLSSYWQDTALGALLLAAVALNRQSRKVQDAHNLIRPELQL